MVRPGLGKPASGLSKHLVSKIGGLTPILAMYCLETEGFACAEEGGDAEGEEQGGGDAVH